MRTNHLASHLRSIEANSGDVIGLVAGPAEMIDDSGRPVPPEVVEPGRACGDPGWIIAKLVSGAGIGEWSPRAWISCLSVGNPLAVLRRDDPQGGTRGGRRIRPILSLRRGLGLLAASRPRLGPHLAHRTADGRHALAPGERDPSFQDGDGRPRRAISPARSNRTRKRTALAYPKPDPTATAADRRLARAFLNRAHVALKAGDPRLARALPRPIDRADRGVFLGTIARDPRLAAQVAALVIAPGIAARWLGRRDR